MTNGSNHKSILLIIVRVIVLVIVVSGYSLAIFMASKTLTTPLMAWIIAAAMSVITSLALREPIHRLSGLKSFIANFIAGVIAMSGVLAGSIFTLNYIFSKPDTAVTIDAKVIAKYSETRHRSRRVGRRTYTAGDPYQVYHVVLEIPSNNDVSITKRFNVTLGYYNHLHTNTIIPLKVEQGLFAMPVIKTDKLY